MPNARLIETIRGATEWAALGIEILGAIVIFAGVMRMAITRGTVRFLANSTSRAPTTATSTGSAGHCCWGWSSRSRPT